MRRDVARRRQMPGHQDTRGVFRGFDRERRQPRGFFGADFADDQQAGWTNRADFPQGGEHEIDPFFVAQFAGKNEHRLLRPNAELRAQSGARRTGRKAIDIDRIVDHLLGAAPAEQNGNFAREIAGYRGDAICLFERPAQAGKIPGGKHQSIDVVAARAHRPGNSRGLGEEQAHETCRVKVMAPDRRILPFGVQPFQHIQSVLHRKVPIRMQAQAMQPDALAYVRALQVHRFQNATRQSPRPGENFDAKIEFREPEGRALRAPGGAADFRGKSLGEQQDRSCGGQGRAV